MIITKKKKFNYLGNVICLLILIYVCIGIFPFALYETDALGIVTGCKRIIETNRFEENYYTYNFQNQPGIYFWVICTHNLLNIGIIESYCIISAVFGLCFLNLSAYFLARLLSVPYFICILLILIFQEIYSACFYMNSATGSAFFMMAALILILDTNRLIKIVFSSILLALAVWTRFDVIIVFPVIIFLIKSQSFKDRVISTFIVCLVFSVTFVILFYISNAHHVLNDVIKGGGSLSFLENQETAHSFFSSQFMRSFVGYFSILSLISIGYGTYLLINHKNWQLLFIFIFPILLFGITLGGRVVAGKHLLYYTPFFAIPVVYTFKNTLFKELVHNKILLITLSLTFILQYFVGFQFSLSSYPYSKEKYTTINPYPTLVTILNLHPPIKQINSLKIIIGGGTKLATADEMLLSSGIFFAPIMWYQLKRSSQNDYDAVSKYIDSFEGDTLHITTSQGGLYPVKNILYLIGYNVLNPESNVYIWGLDRQYVWKKNNKIIIVNQANYSKENYEQYAAKVSSFKYKQFVHVVFWDWERWYLHRYGRFSKKLGNVGYIFIN